MPTCLYKPPRCTCRFSEKAMVHSVFPSHMHIKIHTNTRTLLSLEHLSQGGAHITCSRAVLFDKAGTLKLNHSERLFVCLICSSLCSGNELISGINYPYFQTKRGFSSSLYLCLIWVQCLFYFIGYITKIPLTLRLLTWWNIDVFGRDVGFIIHGWDMSHPLFENGKSTPSPRLTDTHNFMKKIIFKGQILSYFKKSAPPTFENEPMPWELQR